jgi:hypothetical protein
VKVQVLTVMEVTRLDQNGVEIGDDVTAAEVDLAAVNQACRSAISSALGGGMGVVQPAGVPWRMIVSEVGTGLASPPPIGPPHSQATLAAARQTLVELAREMAQLPDEEVPYFLAELRDYLLHVASRSYSELFDQATAGLNPGQKKKVARWFGPAAPQ